MQLYKSYTASLSTKNPFTRDSSTLYYEHNNINKMSQKQTVQYLYAVEPMMSIWIPLGLDINVKDHLASWFVALNGRAS